MMFLDCFLQSLEVMETPSGSDDDEDDDFLLTAALVVHVSR